MESVAFGRMTRGASCGNRYLIFGYSTMAEPKSLWNMIGSVTLEEGVELFDLDMPSEGGQGGVLRVYITRTRPSHQGSEDTPTTHRTGVTFEDCVKVSKKLLDIDEREGIIPENCTLEVSSPGVNRRLRRPEHFVGAIGERVRVKFRDSTTQATQVVLGELQSVSDGVGVIESEGKKERVAFNILDVKEARVDFKF